MRFGAAVLLATASAVGMAGCGGSDDGVGAGEVRAYADLARGISAEATGYGVAGGATSDVADCQSAHATYQAQVGPMVEEMQTMSGDMDREMERMGDGMHADMGCGADAMAAELAHHAEVSCQSADMAENHAEVERHAGAMEAWAAHQEAHAGELGGMMMGGMDGTGGMGGGSGTPTCYRNPDGTFTLQP